MLCNVTSVPYLPILQQGNAELAKLVNVGLGKLKLFQSQNIQEEMTKINQSVHDGKVASNFINHMHLGCLSCDASSAQTVTPHTQPKHTSVEVCKIHCF